MLTNPRIQTVIDKLKKHWEQIQQQSQQPQQPTGATTVTRTYYEETPEIQYLYKYANPGASYALKAGAKAGVPEKVMQMLFRRAYESLTDEEKETYFETFGGYISYKETPDIQYLLKYAEPEQSKWLQTIINKPIYYPPKGSKEPFYDPMPVEYQNAYESLTKGEKETFQWTFFKKPSEEVTELYGNERWDIYTAKAVSAWGIPELISGIQTISGIDPNAWTRRHETYAQEILNDMRKSGESIESHAGRFWVNPERIWDFYLPVATLGAGYITTPFTAGLKTIPLGTRGAKIANVVSKIQPGLKYIGAGLTGAWIGATAAELTLYPEQSAIILGRNIAGYGKLAGGMKAGKAVYEATHAKLIKGLHEFVTVGMVDPDNPYRGFIVGRSQTGQRYFLQSTTPVTITANGKPYTFNVFTGEMFYGAKPKGLYTGFSTGRLLGDTGKINISKYGFKNISGGQGDIMISRFWGKTIPLSKGDIQPFKGYSVSRTTYSTGSKPTKYGFIQGTDLEKTISFGKFQSGKQPGAFISSTIKPSSKIKQYFEGSMGFDKGGLHQKLSFIDTLHLPGGIGSKLSSVDTELLRIFPPLYQKPILIEDIAEKTIYWKQQAPQIPLKKLLTINLSKNIQLPITMQLSQSLQTQEQFSSNIQKQEQIQKQLQQQLQIQQSILDIDYMLTTIPVFTFGNIPKPPPSLFDELLPKKKKKQKYKLPKLYGETIKYRGIKIPDPFEKVI